MPRIDARPREVESHGRRRWIVVVPKHAIAQHDGQRKHTFATLTAAKDFAKEVNSGRNGWTARLLTLSGEDQARLAHALDRAGSAENVQAAVEAWSKGRVALRKALGDAVRECVDAKRAAGRSWQYVENLEVALRQFSGGLETQAVSDITGGDIESWLADTDWSQQTRLTYLRRLETFFGWCMRRGYAVQNPTASVEQPTVDEGPIRILSPRDCRRLLETARRVDPGLVPYFAIGLFAGVRPDEIKRLRPQNIKPGWIEIEAAKSKTRRRRLVEVHPTLQAWLDLGGEIGWVNWRKRWRKVREATAVGEHGPERPIEWDADIMRHSFCSYAFPVFGAAWTAMHAGHSESVLFGRYRELVTLEDAKLFWGILPAVD